MREAQDKIPCAKNTTSKSFKQLQATGFITLLEESFFSSRTDSKSRVWKLNWMPVRSRNPSNEWDKQIKPTVSNTIPVYSSQAQK